MDYLEVYRNIVEEKMTADKHTKHMATKALRDRCNELKRLHLECNLEEVSPDLYKEYLELKELIYMR